MAMAAMSERDDRASFLDDPEVDAVLAYDIARRFAERELSLPPAKKRLNGRAKAAKSG